MTADPPDDAAQDQEAPGQSPLVGRLSPDRELARQAAFALLVRVYAEQAGLVPLVVLAAEPTEPVAPRLPLVPADGAEIVRHLPDVVAALATENGHLLTRFRDQAARDRLARLDPVATAELVGWIAAQRLTREPAQIVYELAVLTLGMQLPSIFVRDLRRAAVGPDTRVVELPDGAGYPSVFLASLHPQWQPGGRICLYVHSPDAEQLAALAVLLLTGELTDGHDHVRRVTPDQPLPWDSSRYDLALVYNSVAWMAAPEQWSGAVHAVDVVSL